VGLHFMQYYLAVNVTCLLHGVWPVLTSLHTDKCFVSCKFCITIM